MCICQSTGKLLRALQERRRWRFLQWVAAVVFCDQSTAFRALPRLENLGISLPISCLQSLGALELCKEGMNMDEDFILLQLWGFLLQSVAAESRSFLELYKNE